MANEDLLRVWQNQPLENTPMPLEEIRREAHRLERRIHNRNLREYAGAVLVLTVFTYCIFKFSALLVRTGSLLIVAGTIYVMYQLYRRTAPSRMPADLGLTASLEFHRRELVRQRDALRSVWRWYLLPLVPGLLVLNFGAMRKGVLPAVFALVVYAVIFGVIWWANRSAAERLTRQIAELDEFGGQL